MVCALRVLLLAKCSGAAARRPLPTRHTEPECAHAATLLLRAAAHAAVHGRAVAAAAPCRSGSTARRLPPHRPPRFAACVGPLLGQQRLSAAAVLRRPLHPAGTLGPVLPLPAADPCLGALVLVALEDGSHPTLLMLCAALSTPSWAFVCPGMAANVAEQQCTPLCPSRWPWRGRVAMCSASTPSLVG